MYFVCCHLHFKCSCFFQTTFFGREPKGKIRKAARPLKIWQKVPRGAVPVHTVAQGLIVFRFCHLHLRCTRFFQTMFFGRQPKGKIRKAPFSLGEGSEPAEISAKGAPCYCVCARGSSGASCILFFAICTLTVVAFFRLRSSVESRRAKFERPLAR